MSEAPFIAVNAHDVLSRHGLDSFDRLWSSRFDEHVDQIFRDGGWNTVARLELEDANGEVQTFYLKRQQNQLARSRTHPFGEPTYAREFRAVQRFARLGIPALEAAFFAQRTQQGDRQAILLTRALDVYKPLTFWFEHWQLIGWSGRNDLILAAAALIRALHNAGRMHNSLYPKHIFLKLDGDGAGARLIDLVETRRAWFGERDRVRDLKSLLRRSKAASRSQKLRFFLAYLGRPRLDVEGRRLLMLILKQQSKADHFD
ncbi:MAG TPA: lipopolysaccharide kinase [Pseudomonas xinjiangensis]|uniref:Lipopolysaccharide kinase n=2 Tax=root TaxID=1 RepID=A0A7V1BPJ3_9GAMM|nr:lipopolysaccharide kinase [Halopseudomonas xinjiangensis]HEC49503.1 lipopolysaccharide kinase [Halopseudomonas xinjiangensis]